MTCFNSSAQWVEWEICFWVNPPSPWGNTHIARSNLCLYSAWLWKINILLLWKEPAESAGNLNLHRKCMVSVSLGLLEWWTVYDQKLHQKKKMLESSSPGCSYCQSNFLVLHQSCFFPCWLGRSRAQSGSRSEVLAREREGNALVAFWGSMSLKPILCIRFPCWNK